MYMYVYIIELYINIILPLTKKLVIIFVNRIENGGQFESKVYKNKQKSGVERQREYKYNN